MDDIPECLEVIAMNPNKLIYDWNVIDYEINRNPANHPHDEWFDDETLREGLQSPSAKNMSLIQISEPTRPY